MKYLHVLLKVAAMVLVVLLATAPTASSQNGLVEVAKVEGLKVVGGDTLRMPLPIGESLVYTATPLLQFSLRYANTTGAKVNIANGWQISSPDGAVWTSSRIDTLGPLTNGIPSITQYFSQLFSFYPQYGTGDGSPTPDTLGIMGAGSTFAADQQLPAGFDDTALAITLQLPNDFMINDGKHICIDSAFWGTGGTWVWVSNTLQDYFPNWSSKNGTYQANLGFCLEFYNLGGSCGHTYVTNAPDSLVAQCGQNISYDFSAEDWELDPYTFYHQSGPGQTDPTTGVWTWNNVPQACTLATYILKVAVGDICGPSSNVTVPVKVTPCALNITSGFGTSSHLTGESIQRQMTVDPAGCPADSWSMVQTLGGSATFSISPSGLALLTTNTPGLYQFNIIARVGPVADTTSNTYIIHGGPGCCVGVRGNLNGVGITDLADLSLLINYLMLPYVVLPCYDAANVNTVGIVDLTDLSMLISYLIAQPVQLPACP